VLGGVCGGLAEYSGVDPLLWRVGAVALALAGPGVPVYLLLWLLMPGAPRQNGAVAGPAAPRMAAPAGPRSPVARITLAGLLIVVGVLALVSRFTPWDLSARGFLGGALLVVGVGLIASAFVPGRTNRAGLIALGVVLSIALAIASASPWHFRGGVGDRSYHPLTAADVHPLYDAGVGNTTVDLSAVDLATAVTPIRTRIDSGVGNLHVVLPASADVQVTVDNGLGNVDVLGGHKTDGYYPGTGTAAWTADGNPEFVLTIDAGIGNVEVDRA
jgi:phage shock protein PspC (stress-responsive transcriptional regulator)